MKASLYYIVDNHVEYQAMTIIFCIYFLRESITIAQSSPVGTQLFVVNATDTDEPGTPNADITFSLADPSLPFSVDPVSGNITTRRVAPMLEVQLYDIVVIARDAGTPSLYSNASFYVTVAAPNFFEPVFQDNLEFSIVEEEIQEDAIQFYVNDADTGEEGRVSLMLLPSDYSDAFNLTFFYDEIQMYTVGQLFQLNIFDRESTTNFTLPVRAVDEGNELFRRTSDATISIIVTDVNDNSPIFVDSPYSVRVPEHTNINTFLLQVVAEDLDLGTNAEVFYEIVPSISEFQIDAESGNITVNTDLDRRRQSLYSFNVTATDRGNPALSNTTTIEVIVTEINDNQPYFDPPLPPTIEIPEDTQPGFILLNITARDNDTLSAGEVTIRLDQSGKIFDLNQDNQLLLSEEVDFEVSLISYLLCKIFLMVTIILALVICNKPVQ